MKIIVKEFAVEMEVKNKGIEFGVHDNSDKFLGDCYVTKTGLEWCKGKVTQGNGNKISWETFADLMEAMPKKK
jgi:hypothetical protein